MNFDYDKLQTGAFYDTKNGMVFSQSGEMVNTTDGGNTWNRYDIPSKPNFIGCHLFTSTIGVGFASHSFYRTQDAGQTWSIIKSNTQPTYYYFPITSTSGYARMGSLDSVYYTKDQGLTWVAQTKGTVNWAFISFVNPYLAYCSNGDGIYRVDFPRPGVVLLTASADSSVVHVTASKGSILHVAIAPGQAMTAGTASGTGYRIKVTSSSPSVSIVVATALQVVLAVPQVTLSIPLQKGWNLISTNVYPADSSIATLFAGKNVAEIKTQTTFWRSGQAVAYNSLTSLQAGTAYMVYMNAVDTLVVVGLPMKTLATSLQTGWNVVGCSYQTTTSFSTAVGTTTKIKDLKQLYQTTDSMVPGKGYFVKK